MKLFALLLFTFSATVHADIYKCGTVYSQSPCGANEEIIKFATQTKLTKPITAERQISSETRSTSGAKIISVITGKVVRVADGDTITVLASTGKEKIRFAQIDAPETSHFGSPTQPYGKEAGAYLRQLVSNKNVRVEVEAIDQYKRNVGTVYVGGTNINREMVKNGFAWVYRQYAHDPNLMDLEQAARSQHVGLWSLSNPIYPSDFRKASK
jgi:endonuclease YncB( thermonuclease family)